MTSTAQEPNATEPTPTNPSAFPLKTTPIPLKLAIIHHQASALEPDRNTFQDPKQLPIIGIQDQAQRPKTQTTPNTTVGFETPSCERRGNPRNPNQEKASPPQGGREPTKEERTMVESLRQKSPMWLGFFERERGVHSKRPYEFLLAT